MVAIDTVWLNAIYNPTLDAEGNTTKVVKFATDITEQQNLIAENQGIVEGINHSMATIEFTPEGEILDANQNFLKAVGYTIEQIRGRHHKMFVSKEEQESESYKIFWEKLAQGKPFSGTFKRINSRGDIIWLNAIYNPTLDANGNTTKVVKFATNITDQQNLIFENKGIVEGINHTMATIEFTPKGEILDANQNFLKSVGYTLEQIRGRQHSMFVDKKEQESASYKIFWERLEQGKPFSGTFKRLNSKGESIWLSAIYNPILNVDGETIKVVKFATDITEQQNLIFENKGILEGINHTMATIEFTPEGEILDANQNFLKTMGYSIEQIRGMHHRMFVCKQEKDSEAYQLFWERLKQGQPSSGTFRRIDSKGEEVLLRAIYNPIMDSDGNTVKVVKLATVEKVLSKVDQVEKL